MNPNPKTEQIEAYKWKPGQSGNPKGMPKGIRPFKVVLREILEAYEDNVENLGKVDGTQAVAIALFNKAVKENDVSAIRELLDRLEGKSKQTIDYTDKSESKDKLDEALDNIQKLMKDEATTTSDSESS